MTGRGRWRGRGGGGRDVTAAHAPNTRTHTHNPKQPVLSFCIPRITRRLPPRHCCVCGGTRARSAESGRIKRERGNRVGGEGGGGGEKVHETKATRSQRKVGVLSSKKAKVNDNEGGMTVWPTNRAFKLVCQISFIASYMYIFLLSCLRCL